MSHSSHEWAWGGHRGEGPGLIHHMSGHKVDVGGRGLVSFIT